MSYIDEMDLPLTTSDAPSSDADHLMLVKVFYPTSGPKYQFVHPRELSNFDEGYEVLCHADIEKRTLYPIEQNHRKPEVSDAESKAFLEGVETAINTFHEPEHHRPPNKRSRKTPISVASKAMDAATSAFFDLMEKNIDRWTYDASSSMLSTLAMQNAEDVVRLRREAADIQFKLDTFNAEFRAFFIESLVNFNCEEPIRSEAEKTTLELVTSDNWKSHNIEPLLAREYEGQTKVEFSQLNKRLNYLLDRKIHPNESVLGPKAIAWTLAQALNACDFTKKQREVLEPILISDFNSSLNNLYRHINLIWIGLDILPQTKLEILKSDAA